MPNGEVKEQVKPSENIEHCCERGKTGLYCENDCKHFDGEFYCTHPEAVKKHQEENDINDPLIDTYPDCDHMCC